MARANRVSCARERPPLGHAQDVARPEPADDERARIIGGLDRQPPVGRRGQDGLASRTWRARRTAAARSAGACRTARRRQAQEGARTWCPTYHSARDDVARRCSTSSPIWPLLAASFSSTTADSAARLHLRRRRARSPRVPARLHAAGLRKGDTVAVLVGKPARMDRRAAGAACSRAWSPCRSIIARRRTSSGACAAS